MESAPGGCHAQPVIHNSGAAGRYVVCMTSPAGLVSELTHDLKREEALGVVEVLRGFFTDLAARSDGWTLRSFNGGFNASKDRVSVSFRVTPCAVG